MVETQEAEDTKQLKSKKKIDNEQALIITDLNSQDLKSKILTNIKPQQSIPQTFPPISPASKHNTLKKQEYKDCNLKSTKIKSRNRKRNLGVLGLGNVDEDLGGGVDDVKEFHDGGAVVGNGDSALVVVDQLVHTPGPQRGPHHIGHRRASVDVAHQLRFSLRRIRPLLQQYDLRLLLFSQKHNVSESLEQLSLTIIQIHREREREYHHGCHCWQQWRLERERERRLGFCGYFKLRLRLQSLFLYFIFIFWRFLVSAIRGIGDFGVLRCTITTVC